VGLTRARVAARGCFPPGRQPLAGRSAPVHSTLFAQSAFASATSSETALGAFETSEWDLKYPAIGMAWRRVWNEVIPFFAFPKDVRRLIYTTNAIEALNSKLRRAIRARGHFPTDEAATKLIYLVLRHAAGQWKMPPREWSQAKTQFAIMFEDRFIP